jgi:hypothetical protein
MMPNGLPSGGTTLLGNSDTRLRWLLRAVGVALILSLPAVVLPYRAMNRIHADVLQLGTLPDVVIVHYLARTASLLYAVHGAILLFVSFDVNRYRPLIRFLAVLNGCFGLAACGVDICYGMPLWWAAWEGPLIVLVAVVVWLLASWGEQAQVAGLGAFNGKVSSAPSERTHESAARALE